MAADASPRSAKRAGTVAIVRSDGSTSGTSSHSTGQETRPSGVGPHGIGRCDGAVTGVLVVVDEHPLAALLLPPPGGGHVGHAAFDLAGERQCGAAHTEEVPLRLDADVDVDPT